MTSAVLLALYTVFINQVKPYWSISRHQGQDNLIKGEKYIYAQEPAPAVLVGSSLSARLKQLPGFYNLAFDGKSPLDGLAIVTQEAKPVRTVLIEMNVVDRLPDTNLTESLTNPVLQPLKQRLLSLRADKQPLAALGDQVEMAIYRFMPPTSAAPRPAAPSDSSLFDKMLANQVRSYARPPAADVLSSQFDQLTKAVAALQQRGVRVVFFEMPVNEHLCDAPKSLAIRSAFKQYFPPAKYTYIEQPNCAEYHTTDGVHLDSISVRNYTRYLQEHLCAQTSP